MAEAKEEQIMSEPLLNYIVYTTPDPLQASPQTGDPSLAALTIVVSNSKGRAACCRSLEFVFIEGTNARDFFADSTGINATVPTGWSLTQSGAVFTAKPVTPEDGEIGADGVVFILSDIKVNQEPGATEMTVVEETSSGVGTLPIPLAKFPAQFTVGDLVATPDTVAQGGSTVLTWSGASGATYELHYTDAQGELVSITHPVGDPTDPLPATGSYEIDNLQANTTFYLSVTISIPGEDKPLKVERTFPVTVQIPPVHIVGFTAEVQYDFDDSSSSPTGVYALLSWDVTSASQVLLNGNVVEENSARVPISGDTTFTLGATGSPETVYKTIRVSGSQVTAQVSIPQAGWVMAMVNSPGAPYTFNWSVDWETGETAGTATSSEEVPELPPGHTQEFLWQVSMDQPPPNGGITAARCTITYPNDASAALDSQSLRSRGKPMADLMEEPRAGAPLLTYAVRTTPDPLQASPQTGDPSLAALTIVVSNSTRQYINCQSISFGFLQGTNARDFFADSTGISTVAPPGWNITQTGSTFTARPKTPQDGQIGPGSLVFMLFNLKVNQQTGTTPLNITEVTTTSSGSTGTGTQTVNLAKFPAQFFVSSLQANPVNVALGDSSTLVWSGTSGATYVIQYQDADGNIVTIAHPKGQPDQPLPSTGSYTVSNLQVNPTVFTLVVTMQVAGSDSPLQVQRQTVVAVSQLTVNFEARPTTVPANGVTKLSWRTTQATSCTLDPGDIKVPTNGQQYVLVTTGSDTQTYTLTVNGNAGLSKQAQIIVSVDRTIGPTNTMSTVGTPGQPGQSQGLSYYPITGGNAGKGQPGVPITRNCTLDPSSKPSRVWLIDASGGTGGTGGTGSHSTIGEEWGTGGNGGNGGQGGDGGAVTLIFDQTSDTPAGFIVVSRAGKGGAPGAGGEGAPPGSQGSAGADGKPGQIILKANPAVQVSQPSGTSIEVSFDAMQGTYTLNWSVDWVTGEATGTAKNSMIVTSDGGRETVAWDNVPMDMPPPYGRIISATCTIEGFPDGPLIIQWPQ